MIPKPPIQTELEQGPLEVLGRYLMGELSPEEVKDVEAIVEENPLYADALEGLKQLPDPSVAKAAGHDLKFKARDLIRQKKPGLKRFNFTQYATAAVAVLVILFVASAGIFFNSLDQQKNADAGPMANQVQTEADAESVQEKAHGFGYDTLSQAGDGNELIAQADIQDEPEADAAFKPVLPDEPVPSVAATPSPSSAGVDASADSRYLSASKDAEVAEEVLTEDDFSDEEGYSVNLTLPLEGEPTLSKEQQQAYKEAITQKEADARRDKEESAKMEEEAQLAQARSEATKNRLEEERRQAEDQARVKESEFNDYSSFGAGASADSVSGAESGVSLSTAVVAPTIDSQISSATAGSTSGRQTSPPVETSDDMLLDEVEVVGYSRKEKKADAYVPAYEFWMADSANKLYENEAYEEAETYLEKLVQHPNSPTFPEDQLLLAKTYMALDKQKEAKKLLKKMIKEEGAHLEEAQELLKELKK